MAKFNFIATEIPDVKLIEPTVYGDNRGFFMETWRQDEFAAAGIETPFIQDNHSSSTRGVLRGLHFQRENTQAKLVRVIRGSVFDVALDLRPGSPWFGRWVGAELNSDNKRQLYAPQGFAHGFLVLSDEAEFVYRCSDYYNPAAEGGVRFDDPDIGIQWPEVGLPYNMSDKDKRLPFMKEQRFDEFERWFLG